MSDVYREKGGSLCLALENEESRTGAREAIRALIEAIMLEPHGDELKITLKGDLAGMLSAARDSKRSPDTGDLLVRIKLVAGARNQLYLQLWRGGVRFASGKFGVLLGSPYWAVSEISSSGRPPESGGLRAARI